MDIKDERRNERNHFEELFPGDVFEFDDKTFMKTDRIEFGTDEDDFYNAVSLVAFPLASTVYLGIPNISSSSDFINKFLLNKLKNPSSI